MNFDVFFVAVKLALCFQPVDCIVIYLSAFMIPYQEIYLLFFMVKLISIR